MDLTTSPPVRYGVDRHDFDPEIGRRLRVFVDGVEQKQVIKYDCEAGTVLRNKLDENGQAQIDPVKRDEVWTEALTGQVTVEWSE